MPADRRSFLTRLSGAVAVLSAGTMQGTRATAAPAPASRSRATPERDDSWLDGLTASHKQIFDTPGHLNGGPLFYCNNYLRGLEASGIAAGDIQAVLGLHGSAIPLVLTDPLWVKYKLGEMFRINDPKTKTASVRNLWLVADDPAAASAAWTIPALQARGVRFIVCNNNLRGVAGSLARQYGGTAEEVRNELVAGLAPGVIVVPAMVAAVHRAQLKGCSYAYAGLAQPPEQ